jgi:GxxExxY protein
MKYLNRNGANGREDDPFTSKVIGIAIELHKELGPGFSESIYHRAMEIDLAEAGIHFETEAALVVRYKERVLGSFAAEMIVEKRLLLEFKALEFLPIISEVQVVQYLKASGLDVGLILNFETAPLQIKRKYRLRADLDEHLRLHEV